MFRVMISAVWLTLTSFAAVSVMVPTSVEAQKREGRGKKGRKGKKSQKTAEASEATEQGEDARPESGDGSGDGNGQGEGKAKQLEAEQRKHMARMAKIERLKTLSQANDMAELSEKASALEEKEMTRHQKVMARLEAGPGSGKGKKGKGKGRGGKGRKGKRKGG